jgi:hypothetical protein
VFNHRPDDGSCKLLSKIGQYLRDYKAKQPRRQPSSSGRTTADYYLESILEEAKRPALMQYPSHLPLETEELAKDNRSTG